MGRHYLRPEGGLRHPAAGAVHRPLRVLRHDQLELPAVRPAHGHAAIGAHFCLLLISRKPRHNGVMDPAPAGAVDLLNGEVIPAPPGDRMAAEALAVFADVDREAEG